MKTAPTMPTFTTKDLNSAAFVLASGCEYLGFDELAGKVTFNFASGPNGKDPEQAAQAFTDGGMIEGRAFADALAFLRAQLHSAWDAPRKAKFSVGATKYESRGHSRRR